MKIFINGDSSVLYKIEDLTIEESFKINRTYYQIKIFGKIVGALPGEGDGKEEIQKMWVIIMVS